METIHSVVEISQLFQKLHLLHLNKFRNKLLVKIVNSRKNYFFIFLKQGSVCGLNVFSEYVNVQRQLVKVQVNVIILPARYQYLPRTLLPHFLILFPLFQTLLQNIKSPLKSIQNLQYGLQRVDLL